MCLTVAGRVVSVDVGRGTAVVQTDDRRLDVSLAPIVLDGGYVAAGEWVLVHTGLAVAVVDEREARELIDAIAAATAITPAGDAKP